VKHILSIAAISMLTAAAGCNNGHSGTPNAAVANLQPTPAAQPAPMPVADTQAPSAPEPVASIDTTTPPAGDNFGPGPSTGETKYTVKAGDTLYHIALTHYGAGKEWKKIVAANPGLSPKTLRAGETIVLP